VSRYVLWFEDYEPAHAPRVGGKNASLGACLAGGMPVPPGFAVTVEAYRTLRADETVRRDVNAVLAGVDETDPVALAEISRRVRALLEAAPVAPEVAAEIRSAYARLGARCGDDAVPVAVRSSATTEDSADASFAGEHDTFLWVSGADAVVEHVRRCWSSVFTDRAIAYRRQMGHADERVEMSVGVQKMVRPRSAGVAFTLNPLDGDRSQIAIDASWGFGEAVVGGEVTPDNYLVDKVLYEITRRRVSEKAVEYRLDGAGRLELAEVEDGRRSAPCLTDEEIKAVARLARRAERHYGCPQDTEWAIDADLPAPDNVVLLQSRPETVWSRREPAAASTAPAGDYLASIVSTLLSPLHHRK
jgi:pyruvate,water dikinase